ncbi:MAG: S46 family peptidase [Planctomycetota bacterium]
MAEKRSTFVFVFVVWAFGGDPCGRLSGDEGMWTFDRLPLERLRERYGFVPDEGWAEHLARSAVRISSGGSGSFVSRRGLILTNHHVGSDSLEKLSTPERNLLETGFLAKSLEEELRCPDVEVLSLVSIEDVTERVQGSVPPGADPASAERARRQAAAAIEKESKDATGLQSYVVTLYEGGAYHLYRYRRYDDVRLVMAPETDIAFFGGDPDNFEYPRHCLDVLFFRVYEDGRPANTERFLRFAESAPAEGDLVFVAGHPGRTNRLLTADHLRFLRDVDYPFRLEVLARREICLQQFSLRGAGEERMARDLLFSVQNSRKARRGGLAGLLDPAILGEKSRLEARILACVASEEGLGASIDDWTSIAESRRAFRAFYREYQLLETGYAFWSELFGIARTLVRLAEEREKPNAERLPGYRESDMESLEVRLYSPAPIHLPLERATLADSLTMVAAAYGAEHPLVRAILAGRSPEKRAADLVSGTKLADVEARREIARGGMRAIRESADPMIELARAVEPFAKALRERYDAQVKGVETGAYAAISKARFRVLGTDVYPDATFTLRLAFGAVRSYEEAGARVPPFTTIAGAFEKHDARGGRAPYRLPESWLAARSKVDGSAPLNFISTADIVGGNSGSPVTDRKGNLVGVIFDGNIQSLVLDFAYSEETARAIAVSSRAIVEALRSVYGADRLVGEILGTRRL